MLEHCGMRGTPSVPSFPGPAWPEVVAPERVLSMGQIELFNIQTVHVWKTEMLEIELFLYLTVYK